MLFLKDLNALKTSDKNMKVLSMFKSMDLEIIYKS